MSTHRTAGLCYIEEGIHYHRLYRRKGPALGICATRIQNQNSLMSLQEHIWVWTSHSTLVSCAFVQWTAQANKGSCSRGQFIKAEIHKVLELCQNGPEWASGLAPRHRKKKDAWLGKLPPIICIVLSSPEFLYGRLFHQAPFLEWSPGRLPHCPFASLWC